MLRVNPFAALRPKPEWAAEVAAVPYDVVNTEEARRLADGRPRSFLRVTRSEIDLPPETDPYDAAVYQRALSNFRELQRDVLLRETEPSVYLYRQETTLLGKAVRQTAVVCCCNVDDYQSGIIKKHEKTRRDKEDDRTRHTLTLETNTGLVFLMHRDRPDIAALSARDAAAAPLYEVAAPDGVKHTVWRCPEPELYVRAFREVPAAYIADGHHRAASAGRAALELRGKNPKHTGAEEYNWFVAALFPASELTILPYHRVVKDLNGLTPAQLLQQLEHVGSVEPTTEPEPPGAGMFGLYVAGQWYRVTFSEAAIDHSDPVGSLDYSVLQERVLGPILGIGDVRTDQRIDFVGGIRGTGELKKRVDSGRDAVAFAMRATSIDHLLRVADAGQIMPPKSTWFEPKLRDGLLVHTLY